MKPTNTHKPAQEATARPWKVGKESWATVYSPSGYALAHCPAGVSSDIPNRANAALIVQCVNEYERLKQVEESAHRLIVNGWTMNARDELASTLASTPDQARQSAQRQSEYVKALEAVAEQARLAIAYGQVVAGSKIGLRNALAKLEEVKEEK